MSGNGKASSGLELAQLKDYVLSRLDFVRFYAKHVSGDTSGLEKQASADGWSERALCPIHGDSKNPQFFINHVDKKFKCHACGAGGSAFDFYMLKNGLNIKSGKDFWQAVVAVANEAGVDISEYNKSGVSPVKLPQQITKGADEKVAKANAIPKENPTDAGDKKRKPISKEHYRSFISKLTPHHFKFLAEKRGLTIETIRDWEIGWNEQALYKDMDSGKWMSGRITIPVLDKEGNCRNIRQYNTRADVNSKMINYVIDRNKETEIKFGSPARLLGASLLYRGNYDHVIICEGEWDCILLNQHLRAAGYDSWVAVTGTAGANTFRPEWVELLRGKHVYVCLDCDPPGKVAATDLATKHLLGAAQNGVIASLRIVELPLEGNKEMKDITDWFLKAEYDVDRLVSLCMKTPETMPGGIANDDASVEAIVVDNLDDVLRERKYIDKKVCVPVAIVSAAERIYHAIRTYKISHCSRMAGGECCSQDAGERHIPYGHSMFIESCMTTEARVFQRLQQVACHDDQAKCRIEVINKVVMEEYLAHQVVTRNRIGAGEEADSVRAQSSAELTHVAVYFLQPDQRVVIEPINYKATGWIRTHPRTSVATLFIEKLIPMEDDFRKFTLENPEHRTAIRTLKTDFTTEQITDDITNGVTRIFHSDDILYAVLLTYLSVQYFNFNGGLLRGWVNSVLCGDSGVGKSATYTRLSDWLEAGQWFSCLTGTRTGLVYSTKQKDGEYYTAAGDYVKASGKIIGVDEVQCMEREETRTLANAIDRGILEIRRVASGSYPALTRGVWMLNPQDERGRMTTLSDYANGCEALIYTFDPMFIRRMDLAVFRSRREEFDYNKFLASDKDRPAIRLTAHMMRSLVYWAWTREPRHIIFGEAATRHCLAKSTELSSVFGDADKVPLVNPNDFRESLARLSVAMAILDRNFTDDLESVIVTEDHIDAVAGLIDVLYSSPDCNLRELSRQSARLNRLTDFSGVRDYMHTLTQDDLNRDDPYYRDTFPTIRLILLLQQVGKVAIHEAPTVLGVELSWVRKRITQLQSVNLVKPGERNTYQPTRKFNLFMIEWRKDEEIDMLLETVQKQAAEFAARRDAPSDERVKNFTGERKGSQQASPANHPF